MSFFQKYLEEYINLIKSSSKLEKELLLFKDAIVSASKKNKKSIIVGNGGSAAIASHFAVDLTKNAKTRCINFNEPDLITCFANDYGYKQWVGKAVDFYGDEGDVLIAISSSGTSENILNGCHAARKKKFSKIITFSGMNTDNPLKKLGDINFWVNSKGYNLIENIHQFWLLTVVDMIIGKIEYLANPDDK